MSRKPSEIAEQLCSYYSGKVNTPLRKIFVLAMLAGVYVGFGGFLYIVVTSDAARYLGNGLAMYVGGLAFSTALVLIVLAGGELFTGNGLLTMACLSGRAKLGAVLKNWVIVYLGNLVGAVALAGLIFASGSYAIYGSAVSMRALDISTMKVGLGFSEALIRGILCNWLVCLAIWISGSTESTAGKILACMMPVAAFVAMGFEHSVANMFMIPFGILVGGNPAAAAASGFDLSSLNLSGFLSNLIPVTIGNLIGGGLFVAAAYWYVYLRVSK